MATNYPAGLDTFTNPTSGDPLDSPDHAGQHTDVNDAVEAIEAELGTDPAGASATVKARLDALDTTVAGKATEADAVMDGDAAGGGLSGTYPNPSVDVDVLTTAGDTLYYNSGYQRLAKGTDGQVLTLASGLPSWADAASGSDTPWTEDHDAAGFDLTDVGFLEVGSSAAQTNGSSVTVAPTATFGDVGGIRLLNFKDAITATAGQGFLGLAASASAYLGGTWNLNTTFGVYGMIQVDQIVQGSGSASAVQALRFTPTTKINVTDNYGIDVRPAVTAGTVGTNRHLYLAGPSVSGSGAVTTNIAVKIENLSGSTKWAFQVGDYQSYHHGPLTLNAAAAPTASCALDIQGTDAALRLPRLTTTQRNALTASVGMMIYNITTDRPEHVNNAGSWVAT